MTDLRSITLKVQGRPRLQSLTLWMTLAGFDYLNDEFQDLVEKRTNDRKEERNVVVASKLSLTKRPSEWEREEHGPPCCTLLREGGPYGKRKS